MRVLAELPHPDFKITIFTMNMKYLIKFEKGYFEQTYKIAEVNLPGGVDDIFKLIDDEFAENINNTFKKMKLDFGRSYEKYEYS